MKMNTKTPWEPSIHQVRAKAGLCVWLPTCWCQKFCLGSLCWYLSSSSRDLPALHQVVVVGRRPAILTGRSTVHSQWPRQVNEKREKSKLFLGLAAHRGSRLGTAWLWEMMFINR